MTTTLLPNDQAPIALVTGAARRLGRAISLALAQNGYRLALHYNQSEAEAHDLANEIREQGGQADCFRFDFQAELDPKLIDRFLGRIKASLGPVKLLVNNASLFEFDLATTASYDKLLRHAQANLFAPVLLAQAVHRQWNDFQAGPSFKDNHAVIINILDQKLANPNPDFFSYTLSKAGLLEATRLMAKSLAPTCRVLGLAPGFTLPAEGQSQDAFETAHAISPLGASSRPDEIAQAVCWLAQARAITGSTVFVDGGQHLVASNRDLQFGLS
jgi:NAD(P)-dependent dehydrogenase (short-subunit alcohol dehydrogenase family)